MYRYELFSPAGLVSQVLCSKARTKKEIYLDDNVEKNL